MVKRSELRNRVYALNHIYHAKKKRKPHRVIVTEEDLHKYVDDIVAWLEATERLKTYKAGFHPLECLYSIESSKRFYGEWKAKR